MCHMSRVPCPMSRVPCPMCRVPYPVSRVHVYPFLPQFWIVQFHREFRFCPPNFGPQTCLPAFAVFISLLERRSYLEG